MLFIRTIYDDQDERFLTPLVGGTDTENVCVDERNHVYQ